ncbi:MAG: ribonuclease III [Hyphomicrobium sp.]
MFRVRKYKDIESKLSYKFKSEKLLECALTHSSVRGGKRESADNERLEFLGDRVLGLAIAAQLNQIYPKAREGELARRFNNLVRGESCASIARLLKIGPLLILSEAESSSGGREKETILADAMEAILGAIYLEAGFEKARSVILRLWHDLLQDQNTDVIPDPKTSLQEWAQAQGLPLPQYLVVSRVGPDHAPLFTAEVRIKSLLPARGEGASKRIAEQAAASCLLTREGVHIRNENV